jgi:hypothetical protein
MSATPGPAAALSLNIRARFGLNMAALPVIQPAPYDEA